VVSCIASVMSTAVEGAHGLRHSLPRPRARSARLPRHRGRGWRGAGEQV